MCECEFEYQYRWPELYEWLLSDVGARAAVVTELLNERDRALIDHLANRCCTGASECFFDYPHAWDQIVNGLRSGDDERVLQAVEVIETNDEALEQHIAARPCFGFNAAIGSTCEFIYPSRWPSIYAPLLSGDDKQVRAAVGVLEERDRALELHLQLRVCTGGSG